MKNFKGSITLQPVSEKNWSNNKYNVFERDTATFEVIDYYDKELGKIITLNENSYSPSELSQFNVINIETNEIYELSPECIDEACDNDFWDYYRDSGEGKELSFSLDDNMQAEIVYDPLEKSSTDRGFGIYEFKDIYNSVCTLQSSSLATKRAIWLGIDDAEPKIMASDAIKAGIDTKGQSTGWISYDIPKEVLLNTRMHLSQEEVKKMLPILQKFADTGEI